MAEIKYDSGISICALAHQMEVGPFGEAGLLDFLWHCSPHANEIVLVDTSPDDNLKEGIGTNAPPNLRIYRTPYDLEDFDFSEQRNYSISHAQSPWILVLDPDERIRHWEKINEAVERNEDTVYLLDGTSVAYEEGRVISRIPFHTGMQRLFQNTGKYCFLRPVCEILWVKPSNFDFTGSDIDNDFLLCGYEHHIDFEDFLQRIKQYDTVPR